jgi:hypothetical protein
LSFRPVTVIDRLSSSPLGGGCLADKDVAIPFPSTALILTGLSRWQSIGLGWLPLHRLAPNHVEGGQDLGSQVCYHPSSNVPNRFILESPAALSADVNEPGVAMEHAIPREAKVGQQGRLVAVQAEQWGGPSPGRFQGRPRDAIWLDAFPAETRPSVGRCCPVIQFHLAPSLPFGPVNIAGPVFGKSLPVQEGVARLDDDGAVLVP